MRSLFIRVSGVLSPSFFTKLYTLSYFVRSAIRSGETQIFGGIPGFDRVTSLG
jgi:hypothetical protein